MASLRLLDRQGKVCLIWLIKGMVILLLFGAGILKAQNGSPSPKMLKKWLKETQARFPEEGVVLP